MEDLFDENEQEKDFMKRLNPNSMIEADAFAEPFIKNAKKGDHFQFVRNGYFVADSVLSNDEQKVFNRTVSLKSSWRPQK